MERKALPAEKSVKPFFGQWCGQRGRNGLIVSEHCHGGRKNPQGLGFTYFCAGSYSLLAGEVSSCLQRGGAMKITLLFLALFSAGIANAETYKCKQAGRTIYSQQPCGDNATVVESRVSVSLDPAPHPVIFEPYTPPPLPAAVPQVVQARQAPPADCKHEEANLEYVLKRLRDGYTVAEDNYLHARKKEFEDALHECRKRR